MLKSILFVSAEDSLKTVDVISKYTNKEQFDMLYVLLYERSKEKKKYALHDEKMINIISQKIVVYMHQYQTKIEKNGSLASAISWALIQEFNK